jgi:hypothetical protein
MKLEDHNIGDGAPQTCLFIGDSGTGKSIAAGSWPKPLYFASCDGRMGSVAEWYRGTKDIHFDIFNDFDALKEKIESFEGDTCPYAGGTIVLDPITNLSVFLMRYSFKLRGVVEWDEATQTQVRGVKGKKKGSIDLTTIEDYNTETMGIQNMIMSLKITAKKHNVNIIFVAHLLTTQYTGMDGKDSHIYRSILTAGKKIATFIPTQFDEVYHFYVENEQWRVKTFNDGIVPARSSFLRMPKDITWTDKNLYELVEQYYIKEEPKQ